MFKRVRKRPAVRPERHAHMLFPFPLLCALVLILGLSGCFGGGGDGGADGGDTDGGESDVTSQTSAQVLTWDELNSVIQDDLRVLSAKLSEVSQNLAELEAKAALNPEDIPLEDVFSNAADWWNNLTAQINKLRNECNMYYGSDADTRAPGLLEFSNRLATMSRVIRRNQPNPPEKDLGLDEFHTPQEALAKLRKWTDELTRRAQALPDIPSAVSDTSAETEPHTEPEPSHDALSAAYEKLDDMSKNFDERFQKVLETADNISKTADEIVKNVDKIAKDVAEIPTKSLNVPLWISAVFSVLGCLLILSMRIWPPAPRNADSVSSGEEDKTAQVRDMLRELAGKLDALSQRADNDKTLQTEILEDIQFRLDAVEKLLRKPAATQSAQPETQYFTVTSSAVADGQPVYLRKRSIRSEIFGTLLEDNPQTYSVFPAMTQTTENGMRGVVASNVLYTGDIKRCFHVPKERPVTLDLFVTVEEPALIRQDGNQYRLIRPGKLSVTSGPY